MRTQMQLEDIVYELAKNSGEPSLIMADRGLMDSVGYCGWEMWN